MSPECTDYFGIADIILERATRAFMAEIYESAARDAYIAVLNAARAVIFEKCEIAVKTHAGARTKLFELIHTGLPFDAELASFINRGFDTKQGVDYGDGPIFVDRATAESYLESAQAFIAEARRVCA
ncbi:MAG: HEPN domain-containing protein [Rhizomicrobium sp.]|nr:HEPN domain-containing protein [Rhizomicrobium sp.]